MTLIPHIETSSEEEALSAILLRVVSELHDVAYLIERIEPQLIELAGPSVLEAPDAMKVMQGIDLAVQKTRGLADFIDTITAAMPSAWSVEVTTALSLVKLAEMQKALAGGIHRLSIQPVAKAAGDLDFF